VLSDLTPVPWLATTTATLRDDGDGEDGPMSTLGMDVFPEPTGLTAVLPGESARAGRGDSG
jgi:hypothetical protein